MEIAVWFFTETIMGIQLIWKNLKGFFKVFCSNSRRDLTGVEHMGHLLGLEGLWA